MASDAAAYATLGDDMPWPLVRFATTVADGAHGALRGVLPPPLDATESYGAYLRRLPLESGLLAEAYAALQL
eukprot:5552666-Prymnesium_polylepis.1